MKAFEIGKHVNAKNDDAHGIISLAGLQFTKKPNYFRRIILFTLTLYTIYENTT